MSTTTRLATSLTMAADSATSPNTAISSGSWNSAPPRPADMDANPASADLGWRNGVWVANGDLVPRHLRIPTVTVPMGTMADIGMPVG